MKTCTLSCSLVVLFFMILFMTQYGVDAQGCCFSLVSEIIPGGQYSVNVSATDSDVSDQQYEALIKFPSGYTVNPDPTSPFAKLSCTQPAGTSFDCKTANYPLFFANFILSLPPVSPNTAPESPSAQVTVLGTICKQQDFCSLVTSASSDKISLGFLGVWPKYVVIIVGVIIGLLLFAIFFYIWRQYNPSNMYRDRSEVTDILHDKNPSHGAPSPAVLSEAATRGKSVKKPPPVAKKSDHPRKRGSKPENVMLEMYDEKLVAQKLGTGLSDSRFLPMTSVVVDMENDTVSEVEIEDDRGRSHDIKMLVSADAGIARSASIKEEKERARKEERERHRERDRERERESHRIVDERERESHRIVEERGRRDDRDRERHRDSKNLTRSATTGAKTRENEKHDRERESRSHRHSTHIPKERSRSRDATVVKTRSHRHSTHIPRERSKSRDAAVAKARENENHDRERESRSHRHSTHIPRERSRSRDATVTHERDGRKTSSRRHRSRSKPRDSTASPNDLAPEIPSSRPKATSGNDELTHSTHSPSTRNKPRTEKEKISRDDLRRQAIRTSASELDIAESGAAPVSDLQHRKSVVSKISHSEKSKASSSRSSRPTTTVSLNSKSSSKRPKKEAKRDGDDSDNESSSSENLPLGDRLPLAMIASTATSTNTTTPTKVVDKGSRKSILKSSSRSKPSKLTTPKSALKRQSPKSRDGQDIEDGDGSNYYESILDDVLNAGDPDISELSTGSEEVPVGKWAQQTLHGSGEKRKSRLGVATNSTSEDDEVPIGRLKGVSK